MSVNQTQLQTAPKNGMTPFGWIITILSGLYVVSPADLIPDVIPVAGWMDDLLAAVTAGTTIINSQLSQANTTLSFILKSVRFISMALWGILGMLVLIFGAIIYQIFS